MDNLRQTNNDPGHAWILNVGNQRTINFQVVNGQIQALVAQLNKDLKQSRVFYAAFQHIFSDNKFFQRIQKKERYGLYYDCVDRIKTLKISDGLLFNVLKNGYSKESFPTLSEQAAEFFTDKTYVLKELMPLVLRRLKTLEERASKTRTHLLPVIIVDSNKKVSLLDPQTVKSKMLSIPVFFVGKSTTLTSWKLTTQHSNPPILRNTVSRDWISSASLRMRQI